MAIKNTWKTRVRIFTVTVWLPIIGTFGILVSFLILPFTLPHLLIGLFLFTLLVFLFTVVELRISDDALEYRRFFRWNRVSYNEISMAGVSRLFRFPYVKLRCFQPPWGRLFYFPSHVGSFPTADIIEARLAGKPVSEMELNSVMRDKVRPITPYWVLGNICALGLGAIIRLTRACPAPGILDNAEHFQIVSRLSHYIFHPLTATLIVAFLVFRVIWLKFTGAWSLIFSFFIGGIATTTFCALM